MLIKAVLARLSLSKEVWFRVACFGDRYEVP